MDLNAHAIELVVCPRCEARPRRVCLTITGFPATRPHASRVEPVLVGWRAGYGEGQGDSLSRVRTIIERGATSVDTIEAALEQSAIVR